MSTKGAVGIKECSSHGEFDADAEDSPCPSCEDDVKFCMFCDMEAEYMINDIQCSKPAPICPACKQVYVYGQCSPDATFTEIEELIENV